MALTRGAGFAGAEGPELLRRLLGIAQVTGCTIDVNASEETTAQMRQELSKLRREALAEAERGDGLRSELKSMAEVGRDRRKLKT